MCYDKKASFNRSVFRIDHPYLFPIFKGSLDSINQLNNHNHQARMKLLGITELRPGPSGNPKDANVANAEESKFLVNVKPCGELIF